MKLLELYKKVNRGYYSNENFENDFNDSKNNIYRFFYEGQKEGLFMGFEEIEKFRMDHSLSLLYLGNIFAEKTGYNLSIIIGHESFEFRYYWTLLCAYHDLGYIFEKDHTMIYRFCKKNKIFTANTHYKNFFEELNISYLYPIWFKRAIHLPIKYTMSHMIKFIFSRTHNIKDEQLDYLAKIDGIKLHLKNDILIKKSFFYRKTIIKYYEYKVDEFGIDDHGILGGYIFFDKFVKSYLSSYRDSDDRDKNLLSFYSSYRHFSIEQLILCAYLSDCIVSHNIFFPEEEDKEKYKFFELNELLEVKKVSFESNPILFLLELFDSIDPIKYFSKKNFSIMDSLSALDLDFTRDSITIKYIPNNILKNEHYLNYINNIKQIEKWMNVKVGVIAETCTIKFLS